MFSKPMVIERFCLLTEYLTHDDQWSEDENNIG
jgi:hypothetical protein